MSPDEPITAQHEPSATNLQQGKGLRTAIQLVGFIASMAALYWCFRIATSQPALAQNWRKLLELPTSLLIGLPLISMLTVANSGLVFFILGRPLWRIRAHDLVAVNAACTLLGYLPLKASLIFRVLWHNRRDGVPLLVLSSWFGAVSVVIGSSLLAPLVSALICGAAGYADLLPFVALTLLFLCIGTPLIVPVAKGLDALAGKLGPRLPTRADAALQRLRPGLAALRSPRVLGVAMGLRTLDLVMQGIRFGLAGHAAHLAGLLPEPLTASQAGIAGCLYFMLQAVAPTGVAGVREGGTVWILSHLPGGLTAEAIVPVVLVVSASELIGNLILGLPSVVWLWLLRSTGAGPGFGIGKNPAPAPALTASAPAGAKASS